MTNIKTMLCTVLGVVGGFVAKMFGGWTEDMVTLVIFMTVDFIMGLIVAGVFHKSNKSVNGNLSSRAGWTGLCKKCVTLLFVLIAHRLDVSLDTDYIRTAAIIGFIINEALSIVENAGLMGVPLPEIITGAIDILKKKKEAGSFEDN